jgi:hypothetical protein
MEDPRPPPRTEYAILPALHESASSISTTLTPSSDIAAPMGAPSMQSWQTQRGVLSQCAALHAVHSSRTHVQCWDLNVTGTLNVTRL